MSTNTTTTRATNKRPREESVRMTRSRVDKQSESNASNILERVKAQVNAKKLVARLPSYGANREECVEEYLHFIALQVAYYLQHNNTFPLHWSPSLLIDQVWHNHILDVCTYYNDCIALCGTLIPHMIDNQELSSVEQQVRRDAASTFYREQFEKEPPMQYWQTIPGDPRVQDGQQSLSKPMELQTTSKSVCECIQVFIHDVSSNRTYTIRCLPTCTVKHLKLLTSTKISIPMPHMRAIFGGHQLEEAYTLLHYQIQNNSTVMIMATVKGC